MFQLRQFLRFQVKLAQDQLDEILILGPKEIRRDVLPDPRLQDLQDDASKSHLGHSFLTDVRNSWLQGQDRWILNRLLQLSWLQERFLSILKKLIGRRLLLKHTFVR